ncbi:MULTISPECIES: ubiquinol-cytochrome c reductase iron-sulfur subunit [unclassified Roseitalea]|uniref:ubiquinol-cytochrome c reductase iron-sulfur subunit n=1 Tax=unclassified Roseitalea TaxID=2639107 RepID=UPI00273F297B|nr:MULTISPECIES: ubiquinol-cytochrome c reductase iron-sulfur subunit [unclassified Roseitalea]
MSDASQDEPWPPPVERRDFLHVATAMMGAVGAAAALWPFIDAMSPSADVQALAQIEVDLAPIEPGQRITVIWRSQPIFIDRRTPERIAQARADDGAFDLKDPATDASRVQREPWLIVVGVCTHLGCVPDGQKPGGLRGDWNGWFCPCHGSHYDTSGRIRKGPAPRNLVIPPYAFVDETTVRIG